MVGEVGCVGGGAGGWPLSAGLGVPGEGPSGATRHTCPRGLPPSVGDQTWALARGGSGSGSGSGSGTRLFCCGCAPVVVACRVGRRHVLRRRAALALALALCMPLRLVPAMMMSCCWCWPFASGRGRACPGRPSFWQGAWSKRAQTHTQSQSAITASGSSTRRPACLKFSTSATTTVGPHASLALALAPAHSTDTRAGWLGLATVLPAASFLFSRRGQRHRLAACFGLRTSASMLTSRPSRPSRFSL